MKLPRAIRGGKETLYVAMGAVLAQPQWYYMPVVDLLNIGIKATGGQINAHILREAIMEVTRERFGDATETTTGETA